jgi:TolB-like protein
MAVGFAMVLAGLAIGISIPDQKGNPIVFLGMLLVFGLLIIPGSFITVGGFFGWQLEAGNRRNKTIVLITVLAVVLSSVGMFIKDRYDRGVLFVDQRPPAPKQIPFEQVSIGVMPFAVYTYDPGDVELAEIAFDHVVAALEKRGLSVPQRNHSVLMPLYENESFAGIAASLGVTHILLGKFYDDGDRTLVIAALHTPDGSYAWSESFDRNTLDLPAIYEEIGRNVATALHCSSKISTTLNPADCAYQ